MTNLETKINRESDRIIELAPNFKIPVFLLSIAIPLLFVNRIVAVVVAILGLFLMVQTIRIKLQFAPTALDIYNGKKLIRSFPYSEWSNWRIFWRPIPILFYFREVNSIHFLPIIFDSKNLRDCLEKYCPRD